MTAKAPLVVAFGGGLNSTAMLVTMRERDLIPDLILFADTGGEKPETYSHVRSFSVWLEANGMPPVTTVSNSGYLPTLYQNCWELKKLPSLAHGFKGCSLRYKREPQDKHVNNWPPAKAAWAAGLLVSKLIGIDAGESHRAKITGDKKYTYRYPLIEWDMARPECEEAIERAGLCPPTKSACYFCPASRKGEVRMLAKTHPDLMDKALAMEARAMATGRWHSVDGLGRHWSWDSIVKADARQLRMFPDEPVQADCMCFDGD